MKELGTRDVEPDSFYYDQAPRTIIARERGNGPLFVFIYTVANHFPWDIRYRARAHAGLARLGNGAEDRRIYAAPDHERAGLCGASRAAEAVISRTSRS